MGELNGKTPSSSSPTGKIDEVCPYCRAKIVVDAKASTVSHARPTCRAFDEMDTYEFLKEVRRQLASDLLSGDVGPLRILKGGGSS